MFNCFTSNLHEAMKLYAKDLTIEYAHCPKCYNYFYKGINDSINCTNCAYYFDHNDGSFAKNMETTLSSVELQSILDNIKHFEKGYKLSTTSKINALERENKELISALAHEHDENIKYLCENKKLINSLSQKDEEGVELKTQIKELKNNNSAYDCLETRCISLEKNLEKSNNTIKISNDLLEVSRNAVKIVKDRYDELETNYKDLVRQLSKLVNDDNFNENHDVDELYIQANKYLNNLKEYKKQTASTMLPYQSKRNDSLDYSKWDTMLNLLTDSDEEKENDWDKISETSVSSSNNSKDDCVI